MSLTLDAMHFQPRSRQGVVSRVKWTSSTTVSVVNNSVASLVRHAAVSSPVSTSKSNDKSAGRSEGPRRWTTIRFSRSITPNSPNS